jgi:hypothetical protein
MGLQLSLGASAGAHANTHAVNKAIASKRTIAFYIRHWKLRNKAAHF